MSVRSAFTLALLLAAAAVQAQPQIRIDYPIEGATVGNELFIEVTLLSTNELQSMQASVDDRVTDLTYSLSSNRFIGTISLSGLPGGERTLSVTAVDLFEADTTATRTFIKDAPPEAKIEEPLKWSVQPRLKVVARCVNDDPLECEMELWLYTCDWYNGGRLLASGRDRIEVEVDTTITGTGFVTTCFGLYNPLYGRFTAVDRHYVYIEPKLRVLENAPGMIVDLSRSKILVDFRDEPQVQPAFYDRDTGSLSLIPVPDSLSFYELSVEGPRLSLALENGAALVGLVEGRYHLFLWSNDSLRHFGRIFPPYSLRAASDYMAWNRNGELFLHHVGRDETVRIGTGHDAPDVNQFGQVVYSGFDFHVHRFDGAATTQLTSGGKNLYPTQGDGIVVYSQERDDRFFLVLHDGSEEINLASSNRTWVAGADFHRSRKVGRLRREKPDRPTSAPTPGARRKHPDTPDDRLE